MNTEKWFGFLFTIVLTGILLYQPPKNARAAVHMFKPVQYEQSAPDTEDVIRGLADSIYYYQTKINDNQREIDTNSGLIAGQSIVIELQRSELEDGRSSTTTTTGTDVSQNR